jgi:hypothetical protein
MITENEKEKWEAIPDSTKFKIFNLGISLTD